MLFYRPTLPRLELSLSLTFPTPVLRPSMATMLRLRSQRYVTRNLARRHRISPGSASLKESYTVHSFLNFSCIYTGSTVNGELHGRTPHDYKCRPADLKDLPLCILVRILRYRKLTTVVYLGSVNMGLAFRGCLS